MLIQNFTYLMFLCAASMLLIVGGVLLINLPLTLQIIMIFVGLIGGIVCFITLIRLLVTHNKEENNKQAEKKM